LFLVEGSDFSTEGNIIELGHQWCLLQRKLGIPAFLITSGKRLKRFEEAVSNYNMAYDSFKTKVLKFKNGKSANKSSAR